MCVILAVAKGRPTPAVVDACFAANGDGAGIAWREGDKVHWVKGLMKVDDIQELVAKVPMPFIAHFRITSVGITTKGLTHPFLMSEESPLQLQGETESPLVFHNGTWGEWRGWCKDLARTHGVAFPQGKWSDSRAMAWLAHYYGLGLFDMIQEKVAVISPKILQVFGEHWSLVPGIGYASNSGWQSRMKAGQPWVVSEQQGDAEETEEDPAGSHTYFTSVPASLDTSSTDQGTVIDVRTAPCAKCGEWRCWDKECSGAKRRVSEAMDAAISGDDEDGAEVPSNVIPFDPGAQVNPFKTPYATVCELYARKLVSRSKFKKATNHHMAQLLKMKEQASVGV